MTRRAALLALLLALALPLLPAGSDGGVAADVSKVLEDATAAHDAAVAAHEASKAGAKDSSDSKWMQTVLRSGTTSDKVAAMTLLVQESPMHNMASLQKLLDLAAKKGGAREGRTMACDALKDLLLQNLLPERKLRWFALKRSYIDFLAILERDLGDTVSKFKLKAMHTVADLLRAKPENEQILLTLLANKIGDTDKRVGSRAVHLMQTLVFEHSAMKAVVAHEVENVAFRSNVGLRTQYYAVIFLSNLTLLRGTDDALAAQLIGTYFGLFEQMVRGASAGDKESDASVQSRLMSALLTGVNRAFPFAKEQMDSETTERHVEALYRLVHAKDSVTGGMQINVSIQALLLLQQIGAVGSELSDRFYRSLYSLLLMPELRSCRKQAMLLNLIYKAMAKDAAEERLKAFVKRLLQICSYHHPPFICGTLFLLSELAKAKPTLRKWIASAPESDLSAQRGNADEEAETDSGAETAPKKKKKSRGAKGGDDDIQINHGLPRPLHVQEAQGAEEAAGRQRLLGPRGARPPGGARRVAQHRQGPGRRQQRGVCAAAAGGRAVQGHVLPPLLLAGGGAAQRRGPAQGARRQGRGQGGSGFQRAAGGARLWRRLERRRLRGRGAARPQPRRHVDRAGRRRVG